MDDRDPKNSPHEGIRKLGALLKDIKIAMMTTVDPDGALRSRPMMTQDTEFDGDLWFFTGRSSGKIESIRGDQEVNLAYASPEDQRYVSISGRAEVVDDRAKAQELWNPAYRAWFPEGLEDPDLALIRVRVESAEYWDSPSSTMVHLAGFAKALARGERYQPGAAENQRIRIDH